MKPPSRKATRHRDIGRRQRVLDAEVDQRGNKDAAVDAQDDDAAGGPRALRSRLHSVGQGARQLAAETDALHQTQSDEQQRRGQTPGCVGGQQPDQDGGGRRGEQRDPRNTGRRPKRSPRPLSTIPPSGRARNPSANTEKDRIRETVGSSAGKNWRAIYWAKMP